MINLKIIAALLAGLSVLNLFIFGFTERYDPALLSTAKINLIVLSNGAYLAL